ncbi:MAG: bifunctional DNA primase/polymerase [Candidatus Thermoplasmatota archaeon]|jgi:hypothetical protein|nr:bifunctional DNA primase/polymerase [Candidatus Thermoplasmatota archaeon]
MLNKYRGSVISPRSNNSHGCNFLNTPNVKKVSVGNRIHTCSDITALTQVAIAVEWARMGFRVFPCNVDKSPIVDPSLGLTKGFKDATADPKKVVKIWNKYPGAAIGWALPEFIIVIDCDVKKDANKRPVVVDGHLLQIGLKSFQGIISKLGLSYDNLNTLSQDTQSGGRQFIYCMPEGVISFNHTGILPGLDIKGFGGYIILPNSTGKYGKYSFRNLTEIIEIPKALLKWIIDTKKPETGTRAITTKPGTAKIDCEKIVNILASYWSKADGRRNDFMLSIAGFIARSGGSESDALYIVSKLTEITGKGSDHINGVKYAFERKGKLKGFSSIEKLMGELENEEE